MKSIQRNTLLIIFMVLTVCLPSCKQEGTGEKWQKQRNEKTDVRNRIREISMEDVLIGAMAKPYVFDDYLIIADYRSMEKMVHIFNKNTFAPLCSFGDPGQGPKEITVLGTVAWNPEKRELYVTDHGQLRILGYQLDSLLQNPGYEPLLHQRYTGLRLFHPAHLLFHFPADQRQMEHADGRNQAHGLHPSGRPEKTYQLRRFSSQPDAGGMQWQI